MEEIAHALGVGNDPLFLEVVKIPFGDPLLPLDYEGILLARMVIFIKGNKLVMDAVSRSERVHLFMCVH